MAGKYFSYKCKDYYAHYSYSANPNPELFKMHTHSLCELYYFIDGKGVFKIEGNEYPLHSGDILIMRPNEFHFIDIDKNVPYTRFAVTFNPELFARFDNNNELLTPFFDRELGKHNLYCPSDFENKRYRTYISAILDSGKNNPLQITSNLFALLNEIAIANKSKKKEESTETLEYKIINYIYTHAFEKISLEEICRQFYVSKPRLCKIVKSATGSTVLEYITNKRMAYAKELMQSGVRPTDIYHECGYDDYSVFYRAYKKVYGVSPSKKEKM